MKFWVDENIPRPVIKPLQRAGHETFTARSSDVTILRLALKEHAAIITRDQDFRKYVFTDGWLCASIILCINLCSLSVFS
jgi:predicted nuclease of predicted toxin-antitoxin system